MSLFLYANLRSATRTTTMTRKKINLEQVFYSPNSDQFALAASETRLCALHGSDFPTYSAPQSATPVLPTKLSIPIPPHRAYQTLVAPPLSTASHSPSAQVNRLNLSGRSLLSNDMPLGGSTLPSSLPLCPPMAPYEPGREKLEPPFNGPCCCAFLRYEAKESGRALEGEAGCGWGLCES